MTGYRDSLGRVTDKLSRICFSSFSRPISLSVTGSVVRLHPKASLMSKSVDKSLRKSWKYLHHSRESVTSTYTLFLVLNVPRNESPSLASSASCTDWVTPLGDIMTNTTSSSQIAGIPSFRAPTGGVVSLLSTFQSLSRNFFRFLTSFFHFVASTGFSHKRHCMRTSLLPIERITSTAGSLWTQIYVEHGGSSTISLLTLTSSTSSVILYFNCGWMTGGCCNNRVALGFGLGYCPMLIAGLSWSPSFSYLGNRTGQSYLLSETRDTSWCPPYIAQWRKRDVQCAIRCSNLRDELAWG